MSIESGEEPRRVRTWKRAVPWPVKLAVKLLAGGAPPVAGALRWVGGFDHGPMEDVEYVSYWVCEHMRRCSISSLEGMTVLELGPGDAVSSALVAAAYGAASTILIDESPFASTDVVLYQDLATALRGRGLPVPDIASATSLEEVLERCRARYLTGGLRSLRSLQDEVVDVSWSQAVLEHVRLDEVDSLLSELHRVHRVGTPSSHRIDFQDHLAESINTLRFSARWWERPAVWRAGVYTNRLRVTAMLDAVGRAGFVISEIDRRSWPAPPVRRSALAAPFSDLSDADLCCAEVDILAVKRRESPHVTTSR